MDDKIKYIQWFCGFYEGEGWVSNDISNNNRLRLGIAQNDKTPLELAQTIWGGKIKHRVRVSPAGTGKICSGYELTLFHNDAKVFINDIKPFMIIPYKITQIETALTNANNGITRRFKCDVCDKDYASPSGRRRHWLAEHKINTQ